MQGRPRGTVGKASASEARGTGFEPPWLVQWSRWESRPLSMVGNGAGAVTHPIHRASTVFPRGTGRLLVKKGVLMHPFAVSVKKHSVVFKGTAHGRLTLLFRGTNTTGTSKVTTGSTGFTRSTSSTLLSSQFLNHSRPSRTRSGPTHGRVGKARRRE